MARAYLILLTCVLCGCSKHSRGIEVEVPTITVADVPRVFAAIAVQRHESSFAVFLFEPRGNTVNLQFSFERGQAGFDWVLRAPGNLQDKEEFVHLASSLGFMPRELEANGVRYLRVAANDHLPALTVPDGTSTIESYHAIPALCLRVMTAMYGLTDESEVGLYFKGVELNADRS